jgi:hypothetical protein
MMARRATATAATLKESDGMPADPAAWDDWMAAIDAAVAEAKKASAMEAHDD